MSNWNGNYNYSNNENNATAGMTQEEIAELLALQEAQMKANEEARAMAVKKRGATGTIGRFLKRREKPLQRAIATRRAANIARRQAEAKAREIGLEKARAAEQYAIGTAINVAPINEEYIQDLMATNPEEAMNQIQAHENIVEATKAAAANQYSQAMLEAFRTNTNATAANFIKQIPSIPKSSRAGYILLAKVDDLYGKLTRNVSIATTNAERERLASKKYEVDKLRKKIRKVMDFETIPPGLLREVNAVLAGEDVASLLLPSLSAVNRLVPAFANYNIRKNARYETLKNQMNVADSLTREKIAFVAALEEILEINRAQPIQTNAQQATLQAEIDRILALKEKVERLIEEKAPLPITDKIQIFKAINEYLRVKSNANSIYKKLKTNRTRFNQRNAEREAEREAELAKQPKGFQTKGYALGNLTAATAATSAPVSAAERRRLMAEAAAKRFKGGKKTRKARKNRKN
jgi:hypothetical protein